MFRHILASAVLLLAVLSPAVAAAVELPPSLSVGDQKLVLNGAGTREKYFLDLYQLGLYLSQPSNQPAAIVAADAPMALHIVIASKLVSQEKLVESLQEGFSASTQGKTEPISVQIEQFRRCFSDPIARGDVFDLIYVPHKGVVVFKNGQQKGSVAGLPFKQALFGIWLSNQPADATLKQALLAGANARR